MWRRSHSVLIASEAKPDPAIQPAFLQQPNVRLLRGDHEEAPQIARRERPSLIIEDLRQPKPGALLACRRLHDDPKTRAIPVILVGSPALRDDLGPLRPEAVVSPPIVQREYFEAVRRFVPLPERREVRHTVNLRFSFRCGERLGQTFTRDLSADGALLNLDMAPAPGTRLELGFRLPGQEEEIRCAATVVRRGESDARQHQSSVAVRFDEMSDETRWRLEGFLARLSARR